MRKIFSIGLEKTGTGSLNEALTLLGYTKWRRTETAQQLYNSHTVECILNGNFDFSMVDDHDVIHLICRDHYLYFKDKYPDALFIHTIRKVEDWLPSIKKHTENSKKYKHDHIQTNKTFRINECFKLIAYGCLGFNKKLYTRKFQEYNDAVLVDFVNYRNFIQLNICETPDWNTLCKFLDIPIPNKPFPHIYKRKDTYK